MSLPGVYKIFDEKWCKQTVWIISDPHFNDQDLAEGIPSRPSGEELVKLINSCVGRKDTLICLGDVFDIECARQLRGYKVLIMGNHDAGRTNYEEVFDEVYEGPLMIGEKLILSHEPIPGITWAVNLHGHDHQGKSKDQYHYNFCADVIGYKPINLNQWLKQGHLSKIQSLHRTTIDKATDRKKKRGGKKYGGKK